MRWIIWGLAALFYLYEFLLRVSPSVMVPELMAHFSTNAAGVGALSAFYLYVYAPLQIPIGILIDYIGARRSLIFAAFICGLGSILFGVADVYWLAALGRLLQGAGSAFAFIGLVYISAFWFPPHITATLVGLGNGLGFAGGFIADETLAASVDTFGWQPTAIIMGAAGILLSALMFFVMRYEPPGLRAHHEHGHAENRELLDGLKWVGRNWQTWLNSIVSLFGYTTVVAFAGLWGVSYLQEAAGINKVTAGFLVSAIFLGWLPGAPLLGYISDRFDRRRSIIFIGCLLAALCIGTVILFPTLPTWMLFILLFFVGIFGASQMLTFPYAIEINEGHAAGTATALTNFIVMMGGVILQPLIGILLDWGLGWKWTMSIFPFSFLIAAMLTLFYRGRKRRKLRVS